MARIVDTAKFTASHGAKPTGFGLWMFQGADGQVVERTGNYADVCRSLPAGRWIVLA